MKMSKFKEKLDANYDLIKDFILAYHPASYQKSGFDPPITAPGAEAACKVLRDTINKNSPLITGEYIDSVREDHSKIYSLLNSAWIGVPESTACWNIPGFAEAVDLMEEYYA
jgi:hypothetical protein